MPASTFRAWVVGLVWVVLISGMNQFFYLRYPSIFITLVCACPIVTLPFFWPALLNQSLREKYVPLMLSLPICKAWARYLPNVSLFGIPLNPGPFTIKEHVIITVMVGVGFTSAYAVSIAPHWKIASALFFYIQ